MADARDRTAWEEEGRRAGDSLDAAHLVLVLGNDARETALAALGLARAQASKRRVALGDLLGEAEPIQRLVHDDDDPHGLVDSFLYGVSINKIARRVEGAEELYVLPSGSEAPDYSEIFADTRWRRLANGFRETGALLVVAAPADAAQLEQVMQFADGAILVGDAAPPAADENKLLRRVERPARVALPADRADRSDVSADEHEPVGADDTVSSPRRPWFGSLRPAATAGVALAVLLAVMVTWLAARPLADGPRPRRSTASAAGTVPSALDSSVRADAAGGSDAGGSLLVPVNPADSATAAAYAVELMKMNTQAGAIWWLQTAGRELPAATFSPVLVQGTPWFRVLVGAYSNRAQADSLLGALRARGEVGEGSGLVINAPYAFLVDSVKPAAVPGLLKYFADRGEPVYALTQPDGSARLYVGAFDTREQASLFMESVRAAGIRPLLVYRMGRVN